MDRFIWMRIASLLLETSYQIMEWGVSKSISFEVTKDIEYLLKCTYTFLTFRDTAIFETKPQRHYDNNFRIQAFDQEQLWKIKYHGMSTISNYGIKKMSLFRN